MRLLTVAAAAAFLTLAGTAQAEPKSFYFNCAGPLPLQTTNATTQTWSATAPTKSYQEGAGCGWLDPPFKGTVQPNRLYDAAYGGDYAGEVRKLELSLYGPYDSTLSNKTIDLIVTADGEEVANLEALAPSSATPNTGAANVAKYTYTVSDLNVPASASPKAYMLSVAGYYLDDTPGFLHGAKEIPSNAKFFAFADLTQEEQDEILGVGTE
jgi:hypothetical protein